MRCGAFLFFGIGGISVAAGIAAGGFALTASPFFKRQKGTKRLCPGVRPARWGSGYLRYGIDPGAASPVCFAAPPPAVYDCVVRSLRSHARIDPVTKPAEGAKGQKPKQSKSQIKSQIKRSQPSAAPTVGSWVSDGNWLTSRAPSRAGSLLQFDRVQPQETGRLSGRLRQQARSHRKVKQRSCPTQQ